MLTAFIRYTQFCVKKSLFDFSKMLDEKMMSTFCTNEQKVFLVQSKGPHLHRIIHVPLYSIPQFTSLLVYYGGARITCA